MAGPASIIPKLGSQPPSVDFIENRMSKYSQVFTNPPIYYNTDSQKFVSNTVIATPRDGFRRRRSSFADPKYVIPPKALPNSDTTLLSMTPTTSANAMNYWNKIFLDSLTQLKTTIEPKIRKPEFRIREDGGWDQIYNKLYKARSDYMNQGGQLGQAARWFADHATGASAVTNIFQSVAPSNPYLTPVLGAIQLILNALQTSADIRTEVLSAFDNLVPIFSEAELFLSTFPESLSVRNAAVELTVAVLQAIEEAIAFFSTSQPRRIVRSLFKGSVHLKDFQKIFQSIKDKSTALRIQGQNSHIKASQQFMTAVSGHIESLHNTFLWVLNDHIATRNLERKTIMKENLLLEKEDRFQIYLNQSELQDILNVEEHNIDIDFIASRKGNIPNRELLQAEQIVNHAKFHAWMRSAGSAKLLILWNRRPPKTIAGITPISVFCTSLVSIICKHSQFICVTWFCGLHADLGNPDARAMLASFIDQLCQQGSFDFQQLGENEIDKVLLQDYDLNELFKLLYWLIQQLPTDITLVLLIDEAYIYGREEFEEGMSIFYEILGLAVDPDIYAVVKILFTSTKGVGDLRSKFELEDQIINVEELLHQKGVPTKDRMIRQVMQTID